MNIHDYCTQSGKNVIKEYLRQLPADVRFEGYAIRHKIIEDGLEAFHCLKTRQVDRSLWEIKFGQERIMYVIADADNVYFLHICRKQKGKAEKHELDTARKRAKEANLWK